jgi:hypothetical protein
MAARDRGSAWFELSRLTGQREPAARAIDAYRQALAELNRTAAPGEWGKTQAALFVALSWLGLALPDTQLLIDALDVGAEIETVMTPEARPLDWATMKRHLGDLNLVLFRFEGEPSWLAPAEAAFRDGAAIASPERDPVLWLRLQYGLAETLAERAAHEGDAAGMDAAYEVALAAFSRGVLFERASLHGEDALRALGQLLTTIDNARRLLGEAAAPGPVTAGN